MVGGAASSGSSLCSLILVGRSFVLTGRGRVLVGFSDRRLIQESSVFRNFGFGWKPCKQGETIGAENRRRHCQSLYWVRLESNSPFAQCKDYIQLDNVSYLESEQNV